MTYERLKNALKIVGFRFGEIHPRVEEKEQEVRLQFEFTETLDPKKADISVDETLERREDEKFSIPFSELEEDEQWKITKTLGVTNDKQRVLADDITDISIEHKNITKENGEYVLEFERTDPLYKIKVIVDPDSQFVKPASASFTAYKENVDIDEAVVERSNAGITVTFPVDDAAPDATTLPEMDRMESFEEEFGPLPEENSDILEIEQSKLRSQE